MSRRLIPLVVVLVAVGVMASRPCEVAADPGEPIVTKTTTSASADALTGRLAVAVSVAVTEDRDRTDDHVPSGPPSPCSWAPFVLTGAAAPGSGIDVQMRTASANNSSLYTRSCPVADGYAVDLVVVPNVSVEDLVASASARVTRQVPDPVTAMSPDPAVGGTVNVGLWLAVEDPGPVSITAAVGPVWATVTARYASTRWDLGNGDAVECDGLGTPIVDMDTVEQGPCGYTYRWPSAPQFTGTDDLAYHASVTGRWTVTYQTSSGGGSLPPIDRTTDFTYQVREIQTLRVADDG